MFIFLTTGNLENNEEVPPKLNELHDSICSIIVEYSILVDMFASFLKNVKQVSHIHTVPIPDNYIPNLYIEHDKLITIDFLAAGEENQ